MTDIKTLVVKQSKETFSLQVEELSERLAITHFEALHKIMEDNGYEPEYTATLITPLLKTKIEQDAMSLNLVKKRNML